MTSYHRFTMQLRHNLTDPLVELYVSSALHPIMHSLF